MIFIKFLYGINLFIAQYYGYYYWKQISLQNMLSQQLGFPPICLSISLRVVENFIIILFPIQNPIQLDLFCNFELMKKTSKKSLSQTPKRLESPSSKAKSYSANKKQKQKSKISSLHKSKPFNEMNLIKQKISTNKKLQLHRNDYKIQMAFPCHQLQIDDPMLTIWAISKDKFQGVMPTKKDAYTFLQCIGKGSVGIVWKAKLLKNNDQKFYAIKQMPKAKAIAYRNIQYVMNQRTILSTLNGFSAQKIDKESGFIVKMQDAFQDILNLYLVLDYMSGKDLRFHMRNKKIFLQAEIRFFAGCIISSLQYLHQKNIAHLDIKPENLVFDQKGYLYLTDFGISKQLNKQASYEGLCGTIGYIAPEIYQKKKYFLQVDFFSMGVVLYQCLFGKRPFKFQKEDLILTAQKPIDKAEIPQGCSVQAIDFINCLLQLDNKKRIGYKYGIKQLKLHPWMINFPWQLLEKKILQSPQMINLKAQNSQNSQIEYWPNQTQQKKRSIEDNEQKLKNGEMQQLFQGYTLYDIERTPDKTAPSNQLRNVKSKEKHF